MDLWYYVHSGLLSSDGCFVANFNSHCSHVVKLKGSQSKDESETDRRSQTRSVSKSSRNVSPEGTDNRYVSVYGARYAVKL